MAFTQRAEAREELTIRMDLDWSNGMRRMLTCFAALMVFCVIGVSAQDYVWLEGENPDSVNAELSYAGWGNTEYLSEGNWISAKMELGKGETIPEKGIIMSYDFEIARGGEYEVWNRMCFMNIRSPFDWRIDDHEWQTVESDDLSTDLMPIAWWNEVSWLPMGKQRLDAGRHRIDIRLIRGLARRGTGPGRILYASDVICLHPGEFHPNGKHKPDAEWRTERDVAAEENEFSIPAAEPGKRMTASLNGLWQYARFDEFPEVRDRTGPVAEAPDPEELFWSSIKVPGERNHLRPDQAMAHRYFYRTRVFVPKSHAGRSFILRAEEVSMLTTVFVNGKRMSFHDAPHTAMQCDITEAVMPGRTNEIWIGIKDFYYAIGLEGRRDLQHTFNTPMKFLQDTTQKSITRRLDYPVKGSWRTGILDDISLTSTGPAYVEDAFVTTSVREKRIGSELTLNNSSNADQAVTIVNEVCPWKGGNTVKKLPERDITIPAWESVTIDVEDDWADPHLWWRDAPYLYELITTVRRGEEVLDQKRTRFGFREWWIDGTKFVLNGVPQHLRADLTHYNMRERDMKKGATPEKALQTWREMGKNHFRLRFQHRWGSMTEREFLDWCDENGVCVRRTISTFDGQHASYSLTLGRGQDEEAHAALFENWRKQIMSRLKEERNHPSVFIWELDNEILYINGRTDRNLVDPEFEKAAAMISRDDPTRAVMSGGGNALFSQALPVTGAHYINVPIRYYPDEAYSLELSTSGEFERFDHPPILLNEKPLFVGEANGRSFAPDLLPMVVQGYRWWGLGAYTEWGRMGNYRGTDDGIYRYWADVAAFVREWNQSLPAGGTVTRNVRVFNDTHYDDPVRLAWSFNVADKTIQQGSESLDIQPGGHADLTLTLKVPAGPDADAELVLVCEHRGKETFRDVKPLHVLHTDAVTVPETGAGDIAVLDPDGSAIARLKERGVDFVSINSLDEVPASGRVLVVGRNAVKADEARSVRWSQLAAEGRSIVVLEQEHPLHGQAVPADVGVSEYDGTMVEMAIPSHPVLEGLRPGDFHTWSDGHTVYRNAYSKPTRGARVPLHCDVEGDSAGPEYTHTPLVFAPVNQGIVMLSQLAIGEKLDTDPVARRMFDGLMAYALDYELVERPTFAVLNPAGTKASMLNSIGLKYELVEDPLAALENGPEAIVVVDATPENLEKLADVADKVREFASQGGWLMLWGLTPEGLEDYNRVVGVDHLIRPFRMEKIKLREEPDELMAGVTPRDVDMRTAEKCQNRGSLATFLDENVFSYVVDYDNIAPFCEFPPPGYWNDPQIEGPKNDRWPPNMVNGVTRAYHWRFIFSIHLWEGDPTHWTMTLPREEEIIGFSIVPNAVYHELVRMRLTFDGDEDDAEELDLQGEAVRQDFDFAPRKAKTLGIELLEWNERGMKDVIGVDNLRIKVKRSPEFYQKVDPLLNIAALVKYPAGQGGIVLNQIRALEQEVMPINGKKKQHILSSILHNLDASFRSSRIVIPGQNLDYTQIELKDHANLFLNNEEGWPDKRYDLSRLPRGRQRLANVEYEIFDFLTSPLASAVTLKSDAGEWGEINAPEKVTGIPVGRRADALFFLHTLVQHRRWSPPRRGNQEPPRIFQYVITYADGKTTTVPVVLTRQVDDWLHEETPEALPDAVLAWSGPADERGRRQGAVYQLRWQNPRPGVAIESIGMRYANVSKRYGSPVLLAVTAAREKGDIRE